MRSPSRLLSASISTTKSWCRGLPPANSNCTPSCSSDGPTPTVFDVASRCTRLNLRSVTPVRSTVHLLCASTALPRHPQSPPLTDARPYYFFRPHHGRTRHIAHLDIFGALLRLRPHGEAVRFAQLHERVASTLHTSNQPRRRGQRSIRHTENGSAY